MYHIPKEKWGEQASNGARYWTFCGQNFQNNEERMKLAIAEGEVVTMLSYVGG